MNVLLLPDTSAAAGLVDLLVRWSAAGLLRPFCVWIADEEPLPLVSRIAAGAREELRLNQALAAARPEEIEFVAFYPIPAEDAADESFSEAVEGFLGRVRKRLLDREPDRTLTCALALAPESPDQQLPPSLFRASWSNLLVAPEDRSAPGEINQLEGGGGLFTRHAGHAAATIAALWATPGPNRPDLLTRLRAEPAGSLQVPVRVVRCFSRVVELGFVVDHLAAVAFDSRGGWPRPGKSFERPRDPERVVAEVALAYLEKHSATLSRRPFREIRDVAPPPLDIFKALVKLAEQVNDYLRRLPSRLLEEARAKAWDRAARYIEVLSGPTGRIAVRRWREEADEGSELDALSRGLKKEPLVIEDGPVEQIWTDLRQTALGLVDGSRLPDGIQERVRASGERTKVVCDPALLAADPELEAAASEQAEEDEEGGRSFLPLLERIREAVESAHQAATERLAALEDPAEASGSEEEDDEAEGDKRRPRRGGAWLRWAVRRIATLFLVAMAAAAVALVELPPLAGILTALAILVGLVLAAGVAARRALTRPPIPFDDQASAELRRLNRILERSQAYGDAERLGRRLDELETWIAILSELLHRPWVRGPFEGLEVSAAIDEEALPAASAVAVASSDRALLERLGKKTREKAFHPGWLSSIYRAVHALVVADRPEAGEDGSPRDAAADTNPDEDSLRRALLDAVRRGDGRRQLDNPVAVDLLAAIDAAELGDIAPAVRPASLQVRPLAPTAIWIAGPPGVAAVAEDRGRQVVGVRGRKASGVLVAPDLVLTAAAAVVDRQMVVSVPGVGTVEVVEVTLPESTGLALLRLDRACGDPVEVAAGAPGIGAGVAALEASVGGADDRWGYVTVTSNAELSVIYNGGPPGLGAPVFDLSGALVALQGERERLLPAAPVEQLLALPVTEASSNGVPSRVALPPEPVSAATFLGAISDADGAKELVSTYWSQRTPASAIDFALPRQLARTEEPGAAGRLSGGAAFLRPLRIMAHRVEVTYGAEPGQLAACRDTSEPQLPLAEKC